MIRLLIEGALLLGGSFLLALGVSYLGAETAVAPAYAAGLSALGAAMALAGGVLTMRLKAVRAPALGRRIQPLRAGAAGDASLPEPLAVVHLAWNGHDAPVILGASPQAAVVTETGGVVHLSLRHGAAGRAVVCRADRTHGAYFNTLKRARSQASIKLVAPINGHTRLEFWDAAQPVPR